MDNIKARVEDILDDCYNENIREWGVMKTKIKDELSKILYDKTRRSPMILPVIMEI